MHMSFTHYENQPLVRQPTILFETFPDSVISLLSTIFFHRVYGLV